MQEVNPTDASKDLVSKSDISKEKSLRGDGDSPLPRLLMNLQGLISMKGNRATDRRCGKS